MKYFKRLQMLKLAIAILLHVVSQGLYGQAPSTALQNQAPATTNHVYGSVSNSVNLHTGQLSLPVELASIPGRNGLEVSLNASYNSAAINKVVDFYNQNDPTGILGLGWSIAASGIVCDPKNTGSRIDDDFYLDGNRLIKINESPEQWQFECSSYKLWQIAYHLQADYWEVIKEDGMKYYYGNTQDSKHHIVKWGNWIGSGSATSNQSLLSVGWNLASVQSLMGDRVVYSYEQVKEKVGGQSGLSFTKAMYLKEITGNLGHKIVLNYQEKHLNEYQDPNIENPEPDAYQERYATRYLYSIEIFDHSSATYYTSEGQEINGYDENPTSYPVLNVDCSRPGSDCYKSTTILFDYDFLNEGTKSEKRLLAGIRSINDQGIVSSPREFGYIRSGETKGLLNQVVSPTGALTTYEYTEITVPGSNREIELNSPGIGFKDSKVWHAGAYTVVTWYNATSRQLWLQVLEWDGSWNLVIDEIIFSDVYEEIDEQVFDVSLQGDHFAIFKRGVLALGDDFSYRNNRLFLARKIPTQSHQWSTEKHSFHTQYGGKVNGIGNGGQLMSTPGFVAVQDPGGILRRFVKEMDGWSYSRYDLPDDGIYRASASSNSIVVHQNSTGSFYQHQLDANHQWITTITPSDIISDNDATELVPGGNYFVMKSEQNSNSVYGYEYVEQETIDVSDFDAIATYCSQSQSCNCEFLPIAYQVRKCKGFLNLNCNWEWRYEKIPFDLDLLQRCNSNAECDLRYVTGPDGAGYLNISNSTMTFTDTNYEVQRLTGVNDWYNYPGSGCDFFDPAGCPDLVFEDVGDDKVKVYLKQDLTGEGVVANYHVIHLEENGLEIKKNVNTSDWSWHGSLSDGYDSYIVTSNNIFAIASPSKAKFSVFGYNGEDWVSEIGTHNGLTYNISLSNSDIVFQNNRNSWEMWSYDENLHNWEKQSLGRDHSTVANGFLSIGASVTFRDESGFHINDEQIKLHTDDYIGHGNQLQHGLGFSLLPVEDANGLKRPSVVFYENRMVKDDPILLPLGTSTYMPITRSPLSGATKDYSRLVGPFSFVSYLNPARPFKELTKYTLHRAVDNEVNGRQTTHVVTKVIGDDGNNIDGVQLTHTAITYDFSQSHMMSGGVIAEFGKVAVIPGTYPEVSYRPVSIAGRIMFNRSSDPDYISKGLPAGFTEYSFYMDENPLLRGSLIETNQFNDRLEVVAWDRNYYQVFSKEVHNEEVNRPIATAYYVRSDYSDRMAKGIVARTLTSYNDLGLPTITRTFNPIYNPLEQGTEVVTSRFQATIYANDVAAYDLQFDLTDRNILTRPVGTYSGVEDFDLANNTPVANTRQILNGSATTLKSHYGAPLAYKTYQLIDNLAIDHPGFDYASWSGLVEPTSNWRKVSTIMNRDVFGNRQENLGLDDLMSTVVYGYKGTFPLANFTNASSQDVFFEDFEDGDIHDGWPARMEGSPTLTDYGTMILNQESVSADYNYVGDFVAEFQMAFHDQGATSKVILEDLGGPESFAIEIPQSGAISAFTEINEDFEVVGSPLQVSEYQGVSYQLTTGGSVKLNGNFRFDSSSGYRFQITESLTNTNRSILGRSAPIIYPTAKDSIHWNHVRLVRKGTELVVYIDGDQKMVIDVPQNIVHSSFSLEASGAAVEFDNIRLYPAEAVATSSIVDRKYRYLKEELNIDGTIIRHLYNERGQQVAEIDFDGIPVSTSIASFRQDNTYDGLNPDWVTTTAVLGENGLYDGFDYLKGWRYVGQLEYADNIFLEEGKLKIESDQGETNGSYLLDFRQELQGEVSIELDVHSLKANDAPLSISFGNSSWDGTKQQNIGKLLETTIHWDWRDDTKRNWQLVQQGTKELITNLGDHARSFRLKWVLDKDRNKIRFYLDGRLIKEKQVSLQAGIQKIALETNGIEEASWAIDNLVVYDGGIESTTWHDASGKVIQSQTETIAGRKSIEQSFFDPIGRVIMQTKAVEVDGNLVFDPDFAIYDPSTQTMSGLVATANPDCGAYPFAATRYEHSPLNEVLETAHYGERYRLGNGHTTKSRIYGLGADPENTGNLIDLGDTQIDDISATQQVINNLFSELSDDHIITEIIDPDGIRSYRAVDRYGRSAMVFAQKNDTEWVKSSYVYDDEDNLIQIKPPNYYNPPHGSSSDFVTTYVYDAIGQMIEEKTPDAGRKRYFYDKQGRVRFMQDAEGALQGRVRYSVYDLYGRLTEEGTAQQSWDTNLFETIISTPQGELGSNFNWKKRYHYHEYAGQVHEQDALYKVEVNETGSIEPDVEETFTYDRRGNIIEKRLSVSAFDNENRLIAYDYDRIGRLNSTDYGDGLLVTYHYDRLGRMAKVGTGTDADRFANYIYDDHGQLVNEQLDRQGTSFTDRRYTYDELGRVRQISGGGYTEDLEYDLAGLGYFNGRIAQTRHRYSNAPGDNYTTSYTYDDLGRLTSERFESISVADKEYTYTYDDNSNLTSKGVVNLSNAAENTFRNFEFSPGTNKRSSLQYNANGNVIRNLGKDISLTYDAFHDLTKTYSAVGSGFFQYGANDQRVLKTEGQRQTLYVHGVNDYPLLEYRKEANGSIQRRRLVYGINGMLASDEGNGDFTFYIKDHLGSVRLIGSDRHGYLAYGAHTSSTGTAHGNYTYTGQERDQELDLFNYRARMYDEEEGIFYATDPARQYHSPYSYVGGNPISYVDPDGQLGVLAVFGTLLAQSAFTYATNGLENWLERGLSFGDAFSIKNGLFTIGGTFGGNQFIASSYTGGNVTFFSNNYASVGDILSGSNINWSLYTGGYRDTSPIADEQTLDRLYRNYFGSNAIYLPELVVEDLNDVPVPIWWGSEQFTNPIVAAVYNAHAKFLDHPVTQFVMDVGLTVVPIGAPLRILRFLRPGRYLTNGIGLFSRFRASQGVIRVGSRFDKFLQNARNVKPISGFLDVAVHGSPTMVRIGSTKVNHRVLAQIIKKNPQFHGQPIRLLSCYAGNCGVGLARNFAKNLSNKLGVPVIAPTNKIWVWPNGRWLIGPSQWWRSGRFKGFFPGR